MASKKLIGLDNEPIEASNTPKVIGVRPTGSTILVEMLNADEALSTKLYVQKDSNVGAPQGYILALGPNIKSDDVNFKVGDRVLLQGTFVPVPNYDDHHRKRGILEVHNIKAVLIEERS